MNNKEKNTLFAEQFVANLIQLGVQHFVISPGSRSTPLTAAIAKRNNISYFVFHDERAAAFFALGIGKTNQLAAMITTSGTAVANAYPAIMEATNSNTPFLLISADRPPELRHTNANQTMDQAHLFGQHVRFFFDFPCPEPNFSQKALASTLSLAVSKCFGVNSGPVHLNCMFREPLEPVSLPKTNYPLPPSFSKPILSFSTQEKNKLKQLCQSAKRPLLVIGQLETENAIVSALVRQLGWPTIIDVSSGIQYSNYPHAIPFFEYLLQHNNIIPEPDLILHLGRGITTKRYELWLENFEGQQIIIHPYPTRYDPSHSSRWRISSHYSELAFLHDCQTDIAPSYFTWWKKYQQQTKTLFHNFILQQTHCSEIQIAYFLPQWISHKAQLFIANSMPIRDCNNFVSDNTDLKTTCNRGVSGIDGIISSAAGWSVANQKPTVLLIGDLSTMHDIGSLFALKEISPHLIIITVNNGGGGIFSFLPISKQQDFFEPFFATAHQFQLQPIVSAFGIRAKTISTLIELKDEILLALETPNLYFFEIETNRQQNKEEHQAWKEQFFSCISSLNTELS